MLRAYAGSDFAPGLFGFNRSQERRGDVFALRRCICLQVNEIIDRRSSFLGVNLFTLSKMVFAFPIHPAPRRVWVPSSKYPQQINLQSECKLSDKHWIGEVGRSLPPLLSRIFN